MTEPARLHPDTLLRKSQLCELANISPNFLTKVIHREHNPLPVRRFPGSTMIRFVLPMPALDNKAFWHTPVRREQRSDEAAHREWEKATRQRWRALLLVIKAKLEAVESNITTIEEEFMAHIVLPDGQTVGQFMVPQIETAYEMGKMPSLLALPEHAAQQDTEA